MGAAGGNAASALSGSSPSLTPCGASGMHAHIVESLEACRERELGCGRGYVRDVEKEISWWSGFHDVKPQKIVPKPLSQPVRTSAKVGRIDPCPCGSGKKYKKCHGQGGEPNRQRG